MKFRKWIAGKYYIKLSISIIVFSMAMVIILSFIFSNIYSKSLTEQMMGEYKASINKMNISLENLNKEMDQIYILLNMDIDIYTFLNQFKDDNITKAHASKVVSDMYQINPYVDSIILYNAKTKDSILVCKDQFDPSEIIKNAELNATNKLKKRRLFVNEVEEFVAGKTYLVSLVYSDTSIIQDSLNNIVILNLDRAALQNGIFEKSNGVTFICENNGNELINFGSVNNEVDTSAQKYFDFVVADGKDQNSINKKIDGEDMIITYVINQDYNWSIINVRAYKDMTGSFQQKSNRIILIGISVLLACLLIGFVISRILYSPIRKVTNIFKYSKYANGMNKSEEISLISEVYNEVMNHVVILEKENEDFLPKIKEDFLRNVLRNGATEEKVEDKLRDYQVSIEFINLFIVIIKIDNSDADEIENKNFYGITAITSALKLIDNGFRSEAVSMFDGEFCLMLNFLNEENNDFEILVSFLESFKALINKMLGEKITIALGGVANSAAECPNVYSKARDIAKYRFVLGYDKVIYQRYIDDNLTSGLNYPKEIEKKLICAINTNNRGNFIQHLDNIINTLRNYMYDDAVVIFLQVVLECIKTMNQVTAEYKALKVEFDDFSLLFGSIQTLEQAKGWMMGMFDEYQSLLLEIDSVKDNKYYEIIEDSKMFINQNYADINLSVESLAEKTGYTPNYFAKIFKNITGVFVNDYIKQVRLSKSKELLKNSSYSINDISNMVGFINSTYFYSAFKKDVGLTPASYRNYKTEDEGVKS